MKAVQRLIHKGKYSLSLFLLLACNYLSAQVYQLPTQGIRQMAMAGSGTALTWNSDVVFYNPAGISDLNLWEVSVSGGGIYNDIRYTKDTISATNDVQVLPFYNLYVAGPIRASKDKVSVGVGFYSPFGNKIRWHNDWVGRHLVQEASFQTIFAQPTVCYKFSSKFSIGAGYIVAYGKLRMKQATVVPDASGNNDGHGIISSDAWGRGFNAGIHFKLTKTLQLGLTYRSKVNMYANSGTTQYNVNQAYADSFPSSKRRVTMPLPQVASFGVGFRPTKKLVLQADVNFNGWWKNDTLQIDIAQNTGLQDDITVARNYKNTFTYRLGINFAFSSKFAVMAGGALDESAVPDSYLSPEMPEADRIITSLGFSSRPFEKITISAAAQYIFCDPRTGSYAPGNFSGTYDLKRISAGLGFALDF